MSASLGFLVPGLPQPLLAAEQNEGWQKIRSAFDELRAQLLENEPDLLVLYSTMWPSIIGHQIQANPSPKWVHVDELFHELGSIPYEFQIDKDFADLCLESCHRRGLSARTIHYRGFPIDTGSVVALKLLTPNNEIPACIVSSNVYADRAETVVFGKAIGDAIEKSGKRCAVGVVSTLSNRLFTEFIDPSEDRIHSSKDDEWNRKMLEFLGDGRLEDTAQLSREIHSTIRIRKVVNFKPFWWLSAVLGQHNHYEGRVLAYEALHGTGGAVVSLTPRSGSGLDKEYDEEDVEVFAGDREVLGGEVQSPSAARAEGSPPALEAKAAPANTVESKRAPKPVGAYPHARRVGDLLLLSGVGPRQAGSDAIPGGPIVDEDGAPRDYDVAAQTRAVIQNVRSILEDAGRSLDDILDVQVFLVDMKRDFAAFNAVYAEELGSYGATRTTVEVGALPTPIAVEFKVLATAR